MGSAWQVNVSPVSILAVWLKPTAGQILSVPNPRGSSATWVQSLMEGRIRPVAESPGRIGPIAESPGRVGPLGLSQYQVLISSFALQFLPPSAPHPLFSLANTPALA